MQFFSEIFLSHDLLCTQITHCFCGALLFCEIKPDVCKLDVCFFPSKEYSSYPSFPQSQYSQYYSSSYSSPYVSANSISPSAIPTSTYSLQESSHNITSQSTESLSGRCLFCVPSLAASAICRHKHCHLVVGVFLKSVLIARIVWY